MGCCGKGRVVLQISRSGAQPAERTPVAPTPARQALHPQNTLLFQYIGKSGMTVLGPITGRRYRFGQPGVIVSVDPRDAPAMGGVPHLQRIRAPEK
jgi:hypothetical protein